MKKDEIERHYKSIHITALKIAALNVWQQAAGYNWVLKPRGVIYPYFFTMIYPDSDKKIKARILLLEGWQSMHNFVRLRIDPDAGYNSSYMELPQYQMQFRHSGQVAFCRVDPGCAPIEPAPEQLPLLERMLWEIYGVLLRIESEPSLMLKYADERALFSRVEVEPNVWRDEPTPLLEPPPYKEEIAIPIDLFNAAKKVPIDKNLRVVVDLRIDPYTVTRNRASEVPLINYLLTVIDASTGEVLVNQLNCADPAYDGIKGLWVSMPSYILKRFVDMNRLPCEIQVVSGRVFRFLRGLILQLPIKLTKKAEVPALQNFFLKRSKDDICKIEEQMKKGELS